MKQQEKDHYKNKYLNFQTLEVCKKVYFSYIVITFDLRLIKTGELSTFSKWTHKGPRHGYLMSPRVGWRG